jgi:hypothetical protein
VERWAEVYPGKSPIVVLGSREDVGNEVVVVDEPTMPKDVEYVKNRVIIDHLGGGESIRGNMRHGGGMRARSFSVIYTYNLLIRAFLSQPSPHVIVFPLSVLIVRTPPLIVQSPVCAPLLFVVTVTIPAPDSLLSFDGLLSLFRLLFLPASCTFLLSLLSPCPYCLLLPIVSALLLFPTFLLFSQVYCPRRASYLNPLVVPCIR